MPEANLENDDRGAIMLMAVFFAVFAVAILYSVVGTAETVLFRERMQDAADAAALSGAVMHARSMNLLVLINIVMAALLAILITIKLVEGIAIIGMVIAAALAWPTAGATLAAIPPLKVVQSEMQTAYENTKPPVFEALEVLHEVSNTVAALAPDAANGVVLADIESYSKPPVSDGFAAGTRDDLPVEDDSFERLCAEGGRFPPDLAEAALTTAHIPALPQLMGALSGPMSDLTGLLSDWFCGDGSSGPPSYPHHVERSYPRMEGENDLAVRCEKEEPPDTDDPENATSEVCEASRREEQEAEPDGDTGECRRGRDCSIDGPYEVRVALAREQCDPTLSPRPYHYEYQERTGRVEYVWTGERWERGRPEYDRPPVRRVTNHEPAFDRPPCGPESVRPLVAVGYDKVVHPPNDATDVLPVCSHEEALPLPSRPARGTVQTRNFTSVTHILGCKRKITEPVNVSSGESAGSEGNGKTPKMVEGTATLGDENFQIRALMRGEPDAREAARIVRLALWNKDAPAESPSEVRELGGFSVAQAEYFYDAADGRDAWMWNMSWRARLRRFRPPEGERYRVLEEACIDRLVPDDCESVLGALSRTGHLIAH